MTLRARVAWCIFVVSLTATAPAWSQSASKGPRDAAAKAHLERGLRLYGNAEYPAAIDEFKSGYQLEPHPDFLYAMAQAQRLAGKCQDAVESYRAFLATKPPASEADLARENLASCEEELARQPPPPSPPPSTPLVQPSTAGRTQPTAPPAPPRPGAPVDRSPFYTDWLGDTLAGLGIAGIAVGTGAWIAGASHASSANDARRYRDYIDDGESAERLRTVALVVGGVGVALLAAGIVRFATRPGAAGSPPRASSSTR